jgi:hypothetical protein
MPDLTGADRAIFDDLASGGAAKKPFPQFIPYPVQTRVANRQMP